MEPRLRGLLPQGATLTYCGRHAAASPATGSHKMHELEEEELLTHALDLEKRRVPINGIAASEPATAASPTAVSQ